MRAQPTCSANINDPKNLTRHTERLAKVLNGNVSFGATMNNGEEDTNLNIWKATGTSPGTANTNFTINHSLGRVPVTIVGQDTKDGSVIYRSPSVAWTKTTVTLRSTGASSVYNLVLA